MAKSITELLAAPNLTGLTQSIVNGIPADVLPPGFLSITQPVQKNYSRYFRAEGTRTTARLKQRNSPSVNQGLAGLTEVPVVLVDTAEHQYFDDDVLSALLNPANGQLMAKAEAEVDRQTMQFRTRFTNLRLAAVQYVLFRTTLYADTDGNLQPTSASARYSIDFGTSADHKAQAGGIIAASWATDGTDILGNVIALKQKARQDTGFPLVHAFYGKNIPQYLASNTDISKMMAGNAALAASVIMGSEIPQGLLGFQWHPAYDAFYIDSDGSVQEILTNGDTLVLTPEPSRDWWEIQEGTTLTVDNIGLLPGNAVGAVASLAQTNGMYSYATFETDPVRVKQVMGDCFLPILKVPDAIFTLDVVP